MKNTVIFHLSKQYPPLTPIRPYLHCAETLYGQIKNGKKTNEWRDFSKYWQQRLLLRQILKYPSRQPIDCTKDLKVHRAWFVEGYPKDNLPRLEADIVGLIYHPEIKWFPAHPQQFEIQVANVRELTDKAETPYSDFHRERKRAIQRWRG
jgi:hypothetical protein